MEQIKKFLRSRGFTLALLACLVAAAAAGVWAVRTVRDELKKSYDDLTTPQEEPAPEPQLTLDPQEDDVWQQPVTDAAESAANVPKPASSASSSGAQSGSGLVHEPSALQGASSPASSSAAPASTQPVSGKVLNAYSGDELVYSSTLGDWRTHNGVDYACAQDAQVCAPAAGKVTAVDTDSRWGSVVCIEDSAGHLWRVCGTADPTVQTGDEVSVGQILGRAGSIPNECADVYFVCRFRSLDTSKLDARRRLIDSFVNAVTIFDDYILITFNYKEGETRIDFTDIESSDLQSVGGP